jgi:hypothetical protein
VTSVVKNYSFFSTDVFLPSFGRLPRQSKSEIDIAEFKLPKSLAAMLPHSQPLLLILIGVLWPQNITDNVLRLIAVVLCGEAGASARLGDTARFSGFAKERKRTRRVGGTFYGT